MDATQPAASDDADHSACMKGCFYTGFLTHLHRTLKPANYLEIGVATGQTLGIAECASIAVDPAFRLKADVVGRKPMCLLFQQTSDQFFDQHSPSALFGDAVDMAFLDGMHLFEFLLRDFINTEKHCRRSSIVLLHDCLPPGFYMTVRDPSDPLRARSRFPNWWTGDVWKVLPVLQQLRPDLSIALLDCAPTGLVAITNLDPASTTLEDAYGEIVGAQGPELDRDAYDAFWRTADIRPAADFAASEQFKLPRP